MGVEGTVEWGSGVCWEERGKKGLGRVWVSRPSI